MPSLLPSHHTPPAPKIPHFGREHPQLPLTMTTAHRATWKAARGGLQEEGSFSLHVPSASISSKDAPTERALKQRHDLDLSRGELRSRLEQPANANDERVRKRTRFATIQHHKDLHEQQEEEDHHSQEIQNEESSPPLLQALEENEEEEHSGVLNDAEQEGSESDSDSSSSEEDEAELRAEVERIRKEREMGRAKLAAAAADEEEERKQEEDNQKRVASANPLLGDLNCDDFSETASVMTGSVAFSVRRRWDDDVVFRNQAGPGRERAPQARFINDTIHNDFHRQFMKRYMR